MSWLAILLALASLGGKPGEVAVRKHCAHARTAKQQQQCKVVKKRAKAKRKPTRPVTPGAPGPPSTGGGGTTPAATPTPTATPGPSPTPTPTPPPQFPSRTGVDLTEWIVRPTYHTLAAGRVVFNAANLGEDDHNLSVRGGGVEYGKVDVAPGDTGTLVLQLPAGSYTLYCSLLGHEEQGMREDISVR